jgi:hypothetical protein
MASRDTPAAGARRRFPAAERSVSAGYELKKDVYIYATANRKKSVNVSAVKLTALCLVNSTQQHVVSHLTIVLIVLNGDVL